MADRPTAESLLISAALNVNDVLAPAAMGITPDMFSAYQAEYRWLVTYERLYGNPPTVETFQHKFPRFPLSPTKDVAYAVDEVIQEHTRSGLVRAIHSATESLSDKDLDAALAEIAAFKPAQATQPIKNCLLDYSLLDDYDIPVDTVPVPWKTLQSVTGGQRQGDLWYVAARLGQGKTWSLCNMAVEAVLSGKKVMFYSLEMSEMQMQVRMHALLGYRLGIDVDHISMRDRIFDKIAYRKLIDALAEQVTGELYIHDSSRNKVSPIHVAATARDYDQIVIDYAGLMHNGSGGRAIDDWRSMASISNHLKEVAISTNTRILAAAQINREGDNATWRPPQTKHLSQSDALGQDADVVITQKQYGQRAMVYSLEKNRHGSSGQLFFSRFFPNNGQFEEITKDEADLLRERYDDE